MNMSQEKKKANLTLSVCREIKNCLDGCMVDLNKSFSVIMSFFFIPQAIASDIMLGSFSIGFKS